MSVAASRPIFRLVGTSRQVSAARRRGGKPRQSREWPRPDSSVHRESQVQRTPHRITSHPGVAKFSAAHLQLPPRGCPHGPAASRDRDRVPFGASQLLLSRGSSSLLEWLILVIEGKSMKWEIDAGFPRGYQWMSLFCRYGDVRENDCVNQRMIVAE